MFVTPYGCYFNSLKVRLKVVHTLCVRLIQCHFNSLKVRLKDRAILPTMVIVFKFQFLKGAIKSIHYQPLTRY